MDEVCTWTLFLRAVTAPLTWDDEEGSYCTELVVGVDEICDGAGDASLPSSIHVQFFATDSLVKPDSLVIDRSGVQGYARTKIFVASRDSKPVVEAKSEFGTQECAVRGRQELGKLEIASQAREILGFGLEEVQLSVNAIGRDGRPFAGDARFDMRFDSQSGRLPGQVEMPANKSSTSFTIRSSGVGERQITAKADPVKSGPFSLHFTWPWLVLSVAAVFGAIGGFLRSRAGEVPKPSTTKAATIAVGSLVGVVGYLIVATGLAETKIPDQLWTTEAGAAVISFAVAFGGLALLGRFVGAIFPGPRADPGAA